MAPVGYSQLPGPPGPPGETKSLELHCYHAPYNIRSTLQRFFSYDLATLPVGQTDEFAFSYNPETSLKPPQILSCHLPYSSLCASAVTED